MSDKGQEIDQPRTRELISELERDIEYGDVRTVKNDGRISGIYATIHLKAVD